MSETEAEPAVPKPSLHWYQFSLRSLFVLTALSAVACSGFAMWRKARKAAEAEYERQSKIARAIEKFGGTVSWGPVSSDADAPYRYVERRFPPGETDSHF